MRRREELWGRECSNFIFSIYINHAHNTADGYMETRLGFVFQSATRVFVPPPADFTLRTEASGFGTVNKTE